MALVPLGGTQASSLIDPEDAAELDMDVPGLGFAFIEFATIEGASKAKKALNGRKFGENLVEAEYFSEEKYFAKQFANPKPNTDAPKADAGMELALVKENKTDMMLDEAPVMAD